MKMVAAHGTHTPRLGAGCFGKRANMFLPLLFSDLHALVPPLALWYILMVCVYLSVSLRTAFPSCHKALGRDTLPKIPR